MTRCRSDVFASSALQMVHTLPHLLYLNLAHGVHDSHTVAAVTTFAV